MKNLVGKKVIVRGVNSGVQYGEVLEVEGQNITLINSRRLWYWSGAASLSQLAEEGVKNPRECKFSVINTLNHYILDACEILTCTESAIEIIEGVPVWKR